jgi:hypothetical protein
VPHRHDDDRNAIAEAPDGDTQQPGRWHGRYCGLKARPVSWDKRGQRDDHDADIATTAVDTTLRYVPELR